MSEIPAAFRRADEREIEKTFDPLRLCIFTTIALIAWIITPPAAVMVLGAIALTGYVRARRRGLQRSRCALGDTRIVIAYLAVASVAGVAFTVRNIVELLN